jgi:cell division protein FtsB
MAREQAVRKPGYDFGRFEGVTDPEEETRKARIRRKTIDPAKRGNIGKALVFAVLSVMLLSLPLLSEAQNTELSRQIAAKEAELDELKSENVRLMTDIESKSAIKSVQSYAEDVLGMQKLDKSQIEYVKTDGGSEVIIPEYEKGFFTSLYNNFLDFLDYIGG